MKKHIIMVLLAVSVIAGCDPSRPPACWQQQRRDGTVIRVCR